MKRISIIRDESAVSPVIATILMVAITVVLAATLYMMLPGADDDAGTPVSGRISADWEEDNGNYNVTITFNSMGRPSRPALDSIEVFVDGDLAFENGGVNEVPGDGPTSYSYRFLTGDNQLRSGASLTLEGFENQPSGTVTVFFDGYEGSLETNL